MKLCTQDKHRRIGWAPKISKSVVNHFSLRMARKNNIHDQTLKIHIV